MKVWLEICAGQLELLKSRGLGAGLVARRLGLESRPEIHAGWQLESLAAVIAGWIHAGLMGWSCSSELGPELAAGITPNLGCRSERKGKRKAKEEEERKENK